MRLGLNHVKYLLSPGLILAETQCRPALKKSCLGSTGLMMRGEVNVQVAHVVISQYDEEEVEEFLRRYAQEKPTNKTAGQHNVSFDEV